MPPGHPGLLDPRRLAHPPVLGGLPAHRRAGEEEVRAPRLERPLRVQQRRL